MFSDEVSSSLNQQLNQLHFHDAKCQSPNCVPHEGINWLHLWKGVDALHSVYH